MYKVNISTHKENLVLIIYTGPPAYAFYRIVNHSYVKHVQTDGQHSVKAVKNLRTVHGVAWLLLLQNMNKHHDTVRAGGIVKVFGFYVIPVTSIRQQT